MPAADSTVCVRLVKRGLLCVLLSEGVSHCLCETQVTTLEFWVSEDACVPNSAIQQAVTESAVLQAHSVAKVTRITGNHALCVRACVCARFLCLWEFATVRVFVFVCEGVRGILNAWIQSAPLLFS